MNKFSKWWLCTLLFPAFLKSQDTTFVNKHFFATPVRDVFKAEDYIYVKTGDGLFKRENNNWIQQKKKFIKPYVFYDKDFYEADFIPDQNVFNAQQMTYLIPQRSITSGTMAQLDNKMFVSVGGSLFEYNIAKYYKHLYKEYSIRDIYIEKGLKVVSTYSGIYINDSIKARNPGYSSGYFCKVFGKYYLCNDELYSYTSPDIFNIIESGTNVFAGLIRKVVAYQGNTYSLNNKSINKLDSLFTLYPIHQGFRYYDLETVDSSLLFCSSTGELFQFNGQEVKLLLEVNSRIRDIYQSGKTLYLSSDAGVYTIQNMQAGTLTMIAKLPFSVKVVVDQFANVWIATENGLFILPDKQKATIPLISGVEFNGGALTFYNDQIFAGSISGLYVIDIFNVLRNFLPSYQNNKSIEEGYKLQKMLWAIIVVVILLLLLAGYFYYYKRHRKVTFTTDQKEQTVLTLDKIEQDITLNNIMTVEGLAEFYKTNPVQLNRLFKTFDTTPGKFMKKVKLNLAKELLKNGETIEQIVNKVGYSASYIKKELTD